jgi:hypothetical protein
MLVTIGDPRGAQRAIAAHRAACLREIEGSLAHELRSVLSGVTMAAELAAIDPGEKRSLELASATLKCAPKAADLARRPPYFRREDSRRSAVVIGETIDRTVALAEP